MTTHGQYLGLLRRRRSARKIYVRATEGNARDRVNPQPEHFAMLHHNDLTRRRFLGSAAATLAAVHLNPGETPMSTRSPSALTRPDLAVKQIKAGLLDVGYADVGPQSGPPVVLLHGWPYDIHSYSDVAASLAGQGYRVIIPHLRGYGSTRFLADETVRNGQQSTFAVDTIDLMDALGIKQAIVAGFDWGSRTAAVIGALWPERCKALVCVSGYLLVNLEANQQPLPPRAELGWWYQYYFATDRGRRGYDANRYEFNKLIWQLASPTWHFDEETYRRSASAFDNPDHVAIVVHNYRWRLGLAPGEQQYEALEQRLSAAPAITVPTITIASDFDGAAADGAAYAKRFVGPYAHRVLKGVGHNVPQEAPDAFAKAIVDVARM
jgi:pimeloyl-ACP methyl ester carboxylesterase